MHPEPFRQTGNGPRTTIVGVDILNLVTYITAWPDSTHDEMAAFIYNERGDLYSRFAFRIWISHGKKHSPKGTRRNDQTLNSVFGLFGTALLLLAYLRCPDESSLTLMSLGYPWKNVIARGGGR